MLPHPFFRQIFLTRTRPRVSWSPAPRAPLTNIQPLAEDDADDASASEGENVQPLAEDDSAEDDASDSRSASEDPQPLAKEEKESEEKGSEEEGEEASRSRSRQVTLRPRSQARPASGGQSGRFISSRSRAARSRSRSNSHTEHLVSDRTGDEILRHWDQSGEAVIRFGYHNLIPHPVLNYVWVGAKKKVAELAKLDPLPFVFTEGGDRRGPASSGWRAERVRQVMGLLSKHWCEWRRVVTADEFWTYKHGFNLHEELFHESLCPVDDPNYLFNFLNVPRDSTGQPLATTDSTPPSSLIMWHASGSGTWVRDLEVISLPHLIVYERENHTAASIMQHWLRMPLVSRRQHPGRAGQGSTQRWAERQDAWQPGQASSSTASAIGESPQPLASGKGKDKKKKGKGKGGVDKGGDSELGKQAFQARATWSSEDAGERKRRQSK